jgi:hypothetical protein
VTPVRYWDLNDGRTRANLLRSIVDEMQFAAAAAAIERGIRQSTADSSSEQSVDALLTSLIEHPELSYGARGWTAIERAIRAASRYQPAADRLASAAVDILSAHPDPEVELRFPGAMLEAALWQAAIRQRLGPTAPAREPLEAAAGLVGSSGARHLSMQLTYRDVAVRLEVDADPRAARQELERWDVDPGWESRAWWYLARALTTIWSEHDPAEALADLDHARDAFDADDAISSDRLVMSTAVQLCAVVELASDGAADPDVVRIRIDRLLDTALAIRAEEPTGALTSTLGCVIELALAVASRFVGERVAGVGLRAIDESRRAGIESVLLQPEQTQAAARRQFAALVERFHDAAAGPSPFSRLAPGGFFPRETTAEVRADAAARFPRFAELSAPTPLAVASIHAALGDRLLLEFAKLPIFGGGEAYYVAGRVRGKDLLAAVPLDDADVWRLEHLTYEDRTWAGWWGELTAKLIPDEALDLIGGCSRGEPCEMIVVPDGVFQRVPWAALRPTGTDLLVDLAVVNVLPSVRLVAGTPIPDSRRIGAAACWAGTTVGEALQRQGWNALGIADAPETIESARQLFERFEIGADHDVFWLHLSGHGHRHASGLQQSIDLPGGDRLLAMDALTLSWPPVVTMSACHVLKPGEVGDETTDQPEFFGLALACLIGGAIEVLGGLAAIDSDSTAQIIKTIFERADDPATVRIPLLLRQAQLEYLDRVRGEERRPYASEWALLQGVSRRQP